MIVSLRRGVIVTTATLVVLAAALYLMLAKPFSTSGTQVRAEFGRAGQGLKSDSPVKIRGVQVGKVGEVELGADGRAHLVLRFDQGFRVPASSVASIEPASVFGPKFVNLIPGEGEINGPYLADGATISRTSDPADLADLISDAAGVVEAIDPGEVATLVHTIADGLAGQGPALQRILTSTETLTKVAHDRRHDARSFLHDGADLSATLAKAGPDLVATTRDSNHLVRTAASAPEGSLGAFSTGLGGVSALVAHGLDKRGWQIGESFRSSERLVALLYGQIGRLGGAVRDANGLLPVYNDLAAFKGADGKHLLGVHAYLPTNPCELILGLCGRP